MGAFYIYKKDEPLIIKEVDRKLKEMGFKNPTVFSLGKYTIKAFPKILVPEINNYTIDNKATIIGFGTFVYKSKFGLEALKSILEDRINKSIDTHQLFGIYTLIFIEKEIEIVSNPLNTYNIYYNSDKTFISSSFLATIYSFSNKVNLNKNIIIETILTGGCILPDTLINEVRKLDVRKESNIGGIKIIDLFLSFQPSFIKPFESKKHFEVEAERLKYYFNAIKPLITAQNVKVGLTGGFDTRLMVSLLSEFQSSIEFYTYTSGQSNDEKYIIKQIAKKLDKEVEFIDIKRFDDYTETEMIMQLKDSFLFNDGNIKSQLYFHEFQNTTQFLNENFSKLQLGLHGSGGEQYRNYERMTVDSYNFSSWLKYSVLYHFSYPVFNSTYAEKDFIEYFEKKIRTKLNFQRNTIDHLHVKKYLNFIYLESTRVQRGSLENKFHYYLLPFAEFQHVEAAQKLVNHLGPSLSFESKMINYLSPELANLPSNYGYKFNQKEPMKHIFLGYLKDKIPRKYFYYMYTKQKKYNKSDFYQRFDRKFRFVSENEDLIRQLDLPLNIELLKQNKYTNKLLISLGHFLRELKENISF